MRTHDFEQKLEKSRQSWMKIQGNRCQDQETTIFQGQRQEVYQVVFQYIPGKKDQKSPIVTLVAGIMK